MYAFQLLSRSNSPHKPRKIRNALLGSLSGLAFALSSLPAQAVDLMGTYKLAAESDAFWASAQARFLSQKELQNQTRALLMPNVSFNSSYGRNRYDGTTYNIDAFDGLNFNENLIDDCGLNSPDVVTFDLNCLFDFETSASESSSYSSTTYSLNMTQPLIRMDRWYDHRRSKAVVKQAQIDLSSQQQSLIIRVAEVYFGVLRSEEETRFLRAEAAAIRAQSNEIKKRFELGLARDTDVLESQAAYDLIQASVIRAENLLDNAREELFVLTRRDDLKLEPLPKDFPITAPKPTTIEPWLRAAEAQNLNLRKALFGLEAAELDVKSKLSGHAPTLDLVASYSEFETDGGFVPSSDTMEVRLNLRVPLYEGGGTSSRAKQARHQRQEAEDILDQTRRRVKADVRNMLRNVKSDVRNIEARELAIQSNRKALEAVKSGYELGTRTVIDVINAQRNLFSAKRDLVTSRYDYILNSLKLKKEAGTLAPDDLRVINTWLSANADEKPRVVEIRDPEAFEPEDFRPAPETKKKSDGRAKSLFEAIQNWRTR